MKTEKKKRSLYKPLPRFSDHIDPAVVEYHDHFIMKAANNQNNNRDIGGSYGE